MKLGWAFRGDIVENIPPIRFHGNKKGNQTTNKPVTVQCRSDVI